ncbi:MAG: carboxypeptidase-like regulatory domain-containing protein [Planctomycetota bacterium]|jgi:protocatechuate 3,4-dioxygenase beta subunit
MKYLFLMLAAFVILVLAILTVVRDESMIDPPDPVDRSMAIEDADDSVPLAESTEAERIPSTVLALYETEEKEFDASTPAAWNVWGKVTDSEGKPVEGARVLLWFEFVRGKTYPAPPPAETDGSGIYKSDIPVPDDVFRLPPMDFIPFTIKGIARAGGYEPVEEKLHKFPHPAMITAPLRLDFTLEPGIFLRGRVVLPNGRAVDGAMVTLWDPDRTLREQALTAFDGSYTIAVKQGGPHLLGAMKVGTGVARSISIVLDKKENWKAPDLVLSEFGIIEGRAVDPYGRPVGDHVLIASPEALAEEPFIETMKLIFDTQRIALSRKGEEKGLPCARLMTDLDGRFRFSGLEEGRYFILSSEFVKPPDEIDPSNRNIFMTGELNARVVLKVHRLHVVLKDKSGRLIPEAELSCCQGGPGNTLGGEVTFTVKPGSVHLVASTWYGLYAERELFIPEGQYYTVEEVVLTEKERPAEGKLCILITTEDGESIERCAAWKLRLDGELNKITRKEIVLEDLERNEEGEFVISVLPDTFRLDLTPSGEENFFLWSRWRRSIEVKPGGETHVVVPMRMGGDLALTLNWSGRFAGEHILFWKRDDDGTFQNPSFIFSFHLPGKKERLPVDELKPGEVYESRMLLEKGNYRIGVEQDDEVLKAAEFTIIPGSTSEVELWL